MSDFHDYVFRQLTQAHKDGKKLIITCPPRNGYKQYRESMDAWMSVFGPQQTKEMESMNEKKEEEFNLQSIKIEYAETTRPIKKAFFYSTGGRKFGVENRGKNLAITIDDNNDQPISSAFNKEHLGGLIKLLTKIHDQLE